MNETQRMTRKRQGDANMKERKKTQRAKLKDKERNEHSKKKNGERNVAAEIPHRFATSNKFCLGGKLK